MATHMPRDLWAFPSMRMPSLIDEMDDLLAMGQDTTSAISVSEDDKNIHIEAAVPGIDPDDVEVMYDHGMLWIRGEASEEEKNKKRKYYRRASQAFSYRIAVPGDIDPNAEPQAECKNGMIMITFPKSAAATPKRIAVKRSKSSDKSAEVKKKESN